MNGNRLDALDCLLMEHDLVKALEIIGEVQAKIHDKGTADLDIDAQKIMAEIRHLWHEIDVIKTGVA